MSDFLFTVLSFVVALGVLITVHEFGHFWVARRLGVKVLRFSVGFGKTLWSHQGKDGTEYVLAVIPLGGYVKMLDEREGEVPEAELHWAFNRQPLLSRTAIVLAGPVFNFLFAIFAFWAVFVMGDTGSRALIGEVTEGSLADTAGLRAGDEIIAVGNRTTPTWETVFFSLLMEADADHETAVRVHAAGGGEETLFLPGEKLVELAEGGRLLERIGLIQKRPPLPPVIGTLIPGEPADQAGMRVNDLVRSVDGERLTDWGELVSYIHQHPGKKIRLEVERGGRILELDAQVGTTEFNGKQIGRIGAGVLVPEGLYDELRVEVRYGPGQALLEAVTKTADMSLFTFKMLGRMLTGAASVKNLSGPISIAQTAGKTASYGLTYFLKFLALVSISLGVLNLLPIPVLDGGHLLFYCIEAIKGSPLSEERQAQGQKIGLAILLALMGLAFYVDLARLLG